MRGSAGSAWATTGDVPTLASAAACTAPTTTVIDRGSKGTTTAVGRGLWSETALIPSTGAPAVVYYDGSATGGTASIKIAWWNGTEFKVESVAGDLRVAAGSATYVKLAFLPSDKPVVAWTTGSTTVKAAVRSAPLGSAGAWSAGVIDTVAGAATRALEIAVNPLGQVGMIYLTNTTTAGRARFVYCETGCDSLSNYVAMSASSDTIESGNVIAAYQGTGIGWCKHDASTYYPAVTYPGNAGASVRYSSCLGALSTCRTVAGWSGQTASVVNSAGVVAKLHLDPTVAADTPRILARNAANNALQAFQMNQACNAAGPYTFTAGNTLGAATSGTAWASLLKSASGWHVVTNLAATNVHYHTSATTNFATTTWHAAGALDTLTLPAAGAGAGGAAVDRTRGIIYGAFGAAVAPFTQFLGVVNDASVASNAASAVFQTLMPDLGGGIALPLSTGQTRNVAMAETSTGTLGVVYVDASIGTAASALLKYAYRDASGSWSVVVIPSTNTPLAPSIAFDHIDRPWVGFYDSATFRYYLATTGTAAGDGAWFAYQFPTSTKRRTRRHRLPTRRRSRCTTRRGSRSRSCWS